jgi:SpoIID/LytB domain protein
VHVPPTCGRLLLSALFLMPLPAAGQERPAEPDAALLEENWIASLLANGPSHASGAKAELGPTVLGNPTTAVVVLRVGLFYPAFNASGGVTSEFSTLHHPFVQVSATVGDVEVIDRSSGHPIAVMPVGAVFDVRHDGTGFVVSADTVVLGTFAGPVLFRPTQTGEQMRVESIRRTNILASGFIVPRYRGALEVARASATQAGRVNLANIVEVESYVPGVVANESLASFHMEALKAQATAARGYAIANLGNWVARGFPFDIVDSASSQVYRGVISEHARAVQAAAETVGLVASYQGKIISALYSSSMGGHTESNEWIFPSPSNQLPGLNAEPYLRGVYDGTGTPPDLTDPAVFAAFWKTQQPQTFDSCAQVTNRFSRWHLSLPADQVKARLPGRSVLISGTADGAITDLTLTLAMEASRRAAVARLTLTTGIVEVRGWDNLRFVLGRTGVPPATATLNCGTAAAQNFTLNNPSVVEPQFDTAGTLTHVLVWGGGWGHNVGMSQFGANGRARAGQSFLDILNGYYTGVDVGSYPIDIGLSLGSGPPTLRQWFQAPAGQGTLEIRPRGLKRLIVHVNEQFDLMLRAEDLSLPVVRVDLTPYLVPGLNVVHFTAGGRGAATVSVIVD